MHARLRRLTATLANESKRTVRRSQQLKRAVDLALRCTRWPFPALSDLFMFYRFKGKRKDPEAPKLRNRFRSKTKGCIV